MESIKFIKSIFDSFGPLSENSFNLLYDLLEYEVHCKGDVFVEKDKINKKEYFIISGICKSFLINPKGENITITFYSDKSVLSPNSARSYKGKSIFNFQALTEVKLAAINSDKFEKMMIQNIEIRNLGYSIMINELSQKVDKEIAMASMTAKERLIKLRTQYPLLENLIPHTDIATYLGITNISLSRLRNQLVR
jgi:CRP-like cAMP-binding protein